MPGRIKPASPGIAFKSQWRGLLFGWKWKVQEFDLVRLNFEIDRILALFSLELSLLGYCFLLQLPLPETEESRKTKREMTMVNQGLRTSLPLAEIMERIKAETGVENIQFTDEALRQFREMDKEEKEEK